MGHFDKDQLANIHCHCWKERLEVSELTKFKSNASKASDSDIAPHKVA